MKTIKHILALCLSLFMLTSLVICSGVFTASAVEGAGLAQTTFRSYGADISFWNVYASSGNDYSKVDFKKMKADGCEFVILRIGYEASASRQNTLDTAFLEYYKRGREAGMPMGVYFYQLGDTYEKAVEDANWVIKVIEDNNMYFEYPIYYDVEDMEKGDKPVNLGSAKMEQLCLGWCETLAAAGYFPAIYGGGWSVLDKLSDDFKTKYDSWYAAYPSIENPHLVRDYSAKYNMWQYAASGYNFDGVPANANLDVNVCYKDYPAIMKKYGYNNCGPDEKGLLEQAVALAQTKKYSDFGATELSNFRSAFSKAQSVLKSSSSKSDDYKNARVALESAMNVNASGVSKGKKYTATAGTRGDEWDDDGVRLTDGVKASNDPGTSAYAGWKNNTQITVDLGSAQSCNSFIAYLAGGDWGIEVPNSSEIKMEISLSNDGTSFNKIATTSVVQNTTKYGNWQLYTVTANATSSASGRYVRFDITCTAKNNYIWMDEVEVIKGEPKLSGAVYVSKMNTKINNGECVVFTPSFGEISVSSASIAWTYNVVAKWSEKDKAYVVTSSAASNGESTPAIKLASDEIAICAHNWETDVSDSPVAGSAQNQALLATAKVGDLISFDGVNISSASLSAAPYVKVSSPASSELPDNPTHTHTPGKEADCTNPQTCTDCGATLVNAYGHDDGEWVENGDYMDLVCTVCGAWLDSKPKDEIKEEQPPEDSFGMRGDVNDSGDIDSMDYVLLKRYYFETFDFDANALLLADVDCNGSVDSMDYVVLKRAYFGTYTIQNPYVYF